MVPLGVVAWLMIDVNQATVETANQELQLAVAEDVARSVDGLVRETQDELETVGRVLLDEGLDEAATISLSTSLVAGYERLDHVAIYDARGALIDVVSQRNAERPDPPEQLEGPWMEEARARGVASGEVIRPDDDAAPRLPLVVPLEVGDTLTGFAATWVSLQPVDARVRRLAEVRFENRSNALLLVDERHRYLTHADPAKVLSDASEEGALVGIEPGAVTGRFSQSGEYARQGEDTVGTVVGMQTRPWAVVVQLPSDVVYASILTMRSIVLWTVGIVILLVLLLGVFAARQVTRPIDELSAFAEDLAQRRFDKRVKLQTLDEFAVLGQVMSTAAADLEESEKRIKEEVAIRSDLGRYLPAELVDKVVKREQDMGLGGRRRDITVLFADVVGFTPLTNELEAERVVALLNELFTILTEIVFRHEGTVDKFIGDCVMAIWGAPREQPDHAERALAAAEDMMRWLEAGNEEWESKYGVKIELAIGVHSGEAIVGNVGSDTRMEFTAIGDTVNVGARLEAIARPGQVLVTRATVERAGDTFEFVRIGPRKFAGRAEEVELLELVT